MPKSKIAVAVATAIGAAGAANAADVAVTLTNVSTGSINGESNGFLSGTLTGTYNTASGVVTMDAGTTTVLFNLSPLPNNELFTHNHTNWTTGGGAYSASAYNCAEGQFGGSVGAHLCGNWSYGGNFVNESSVNYAAIPGTRTLGGDDGVVGPQQQGSDYAATTASFGGGTLVMQSALWNTLGMNGSSTAGVELVFSAVPVPAAVWLFGSALGLLGWLRRRSQA